MRTMAVKAARILESGWNAFFRIIVRSLLPERCSSSLSIVWHSRFPAQGVTVSSHAEDRFDCVVGELALFYFGAQRAGGRIWREPGAPRPIGRQRLESIRRREDSRRLRNAIAGQASVVAGSVEPFVVT